VAAAAKTPQSRPEPSPRTPAQGQAPGSHRRTGASAQVVRVRADAAAGGNTPFRRVTEADLDGVPQALLDNSFHTKARRAGAVFPRGR
jgi:hypothetical protein